MIGAIIGDTVGSRFEFNNIKTKDFELWHSSCRPTDDSIMTLAIMDMCNSGYVPNNKDGIIDTFKKWGKKYPNAGYGGHFYHWVLGTDRNPYNSFGNGSAMRVSAIGWFSNSEEEVIKNSKAVTEVTHNHPEGLKGAQVTAMCIYYARMGKDKEFLRKYIESQYDVNLSYDDLVKNYKHEAEICQCTLPQALFCFLISKDFEDCLRTTISIGGDCDTTAAISMAIAEAYYGIPNGYRESLYKFLDEYQIKTIEKFEKNIKN